MKIESFEKNRQVTELQLFFFTVTVVEEVLFYIGLLC